MKKKLFSVLLALTLCGSLTIPVFAGPAEEVPAQEGTEVLISEEFPAPTDPHEKEGESEGTNTSTVMWLWTDSGDTNTINAISAGVGDHNHYFEKGKLEKTWYEREGDQHQKWGLYVSYCVYGCGAKSTLEEAIANWTPHSWTKGSLVGYQSSGAGTHKAEYNYSCVCGETTTKIESTSESHSLQKMGYTGNNYHQGTRHYFEYEHKCLQCGYTKTLYESSSCPGPQGGGCIMPDTPINRIDPPVEVQGVTGPEDVTAPEDATLPEETVLPEEVITPKETVLPEDTTEPENTDTPEETA